MWHKFLSILLYLCRVYNVFPTINVNGVSKYLQLRPSELKSYEDEVKAVLHRYLRRLQWLLSGKNQTCLLKSISQI